ncbi:ABC transporter permease [Leptobacterium flavescens]|uniref:ABC transporter permease n=1 Tax=Leptobacterium flavescens TaxID=472055 RepID=A0A6P0UXL6_9FLAO|nr:ABC transporter permease [Leptobacterium flavescens]NER15206.1 ABC transporter permease [Leptobacterium flavescens]
MKTIITVIKKEFTDIFRDKRTLISAILVPALAFPLLIVGVSKLRVKLSDQEEGKKLKIAFIQAPESLKSGFGKGNFEFMDLDLEDGKTAILNDSLDAMLAFGSNFSQQIDQLKPGDLNIYYKSTNETAYDRVSEEVKSFEEVLLQERMQKLNISSEAIQPLKISENDLAPPKEQIGRRIGGFLPYMFILFCFMGCVVPATALITGEKESGTIETLLTVPASRFKILLGKMITIAMVGLSASLITLLGMVAGLKFLPNIPEDFLEVISNLLGAKFILMLIAMLVPLSLFFAGTLSALVVRAKSFREAQSYVSPLTFLVIIPAMLALIPGVSLNWQTVWIPILNIALATKEIIAGTISIPMYASIVLSLIVLAVMALMASIRQFSKEGMVLK